jgi:hypothetical protein
MIRDAAAIMEGEKITTQINSEKITRHRLPERPKVNITRPPLLHQHIVFEMHTGGGGFGVADCGTGGGV